MPNFSHQTQNQTRLIAKVIWEILKGSRFDSWADLTDAVKTRCVKLRLKVDDDTLNAAYTLIGSHAELVRPQLKATPPPGLPPRAGDELSRSEASRIYQAVLARYAAEHPVEPQAIPERPDFELSDIAKKLSAFDEPHILAYFWNLVHEGGDRIEALQHLGQVRVTRPADWSTEKIRREHDTIIRPKERLIECFCCRTRGRLYAHHVIEVQHGGSNTLRNRVPLCFSCHKRVHPWLTEELPERPSEHGFERLADIWARMGAKKSEALQ